MTEKDIINENNERTCSPADVVSHKDTDAPARVKPYLWHLFWAGVYLSMIPLFALIYWLMPLDFYHTTMVYEKETLNAEASSILAQFQHDAILAGHEEHFGNWILTSGNITWSALKYNHEDPEIEIHAYLLLTKEKSEEKVCLSVVFLLNKKAAIVVDGVSYRDIRLLDDGFEYKHYLGESDSQNPFDISQFCVKRHLGTGYFGFTPALNNHFTAFVNALDGFPGHVRHSYWRALYLSSITITTLGYGDIVPITGRARFATSSEAVFGIIVIGLFLNAIAGKPKREELRYLDDDR